MSKRGKRTWNIPLAKRIKRKFEDGLHFVNVVKKGITENLKDRGFKIVYDGKRNDFPNFLISLVEPAPYTRAAIDKRRAFVAGTGLSDIDISGQIVNDEYTFGELHRRLAQDFNYSDRFAFCDTIVYTPNGVICPDFNRNVSSSNNADESTDLTPSTTLAPRS